MPRNVVGNIATRTTQHSLYLLFLSNQSHIIIISNYISSSSFIYIILIISYSSYSYYHIIIIYHLCMDSLHIYSSLQISHIMSSLDNDLVITVDMMLPWPVVKHLFSIQSRHSVAAFNEYLCYP